MRGKGRAPQKRSPVAPPRALTAPSRRGEEDQLRWALWFAQADRSSWREGDWLNALEDAKSLGFPRRSQSARGSEIVRRPDFAEVKRWLTSLQGVLRGLFEKLDRERHKAAVDEEGEPFVMPVGILFTGEAILAAEPPYRRVQMAFAPKGATIQRRLVTGAVLRVAMLLAQTDLSRLKRCPECQRLFLAVRRQRFDTAQCSLRDRVRRFRQKHVRRRRPERKETTR